MLALDKRMSKPRRALPGTTYFISRRCSERRFFLAPSALINQIILYCLAYAAHVFGMQVHAVCAMSNHWHVIVTDPHGYVSDFMHRAHLLVSKCTNTLRKRGENMWTNDEPSCIELPDDETIIAKMVYVLTNPVTARLVAAVDKWPGVCLGPERIGTSLPIERPPVYFSSNGPAPEVLELSIVPPAQALERRSLPELIAGLRESITAVENRTDGPFLGLAEVLAQDPFSQPSSPEPRPRRRPRVAGVIREVFLATLTSMRTFWARYADARRRWLGGETSVVFPAGTNALSRVPGITIADYVPG